MSWHPPARRPEACTRGTVWARPGWLGWFQLPVERLSPAPEQPFLVLDPRLRPSTQVLRLRVATQAKPPPRRTISPFSSCSSEASLDFSNPVHNHPATRPRHRHSI